MGQPQKVKLHIIGIPEKEERERNIYQINARHQTTRTGSLGTLSRINVKQQQKVYLDIL